MSLRNPVTAATRIALAVVAALVMAACPSVSAIDADAGIYD